MSSARQLWIFPLLMLAGVHSLALTDRALAQGDVWQTRAAMPTPRRLLAAAAEGGRIYTFGGCGSPCFDPPSHTSTFEETRVEVYDPVADSWTVRAAMPTILFGAAAAAPGNGKIYTMGGLVSGNVVQEYDPAADSWTLKAPMPTPRYGLAAVALDGKIYALGGNGPSPALEVYDPATNTWSSRAPMPAARVFLAAAAVGGRIYAVGGSPDCCGHSQTNVVEEYNPTTDSWTTRAPLPTAQQGSAAVSFHGRMLVFGGFVPGTGVHATTFEYDPGTNSWTPRAPMPTARDQAPAVVTGAAAYVVGGSIDCHCRPLDDNERYQPLGPPTADLAVTKDDGVEEVSPGAVVTYAIEVTNNGPAAVSGAAVTDAFSPQLINVSWQCGAPTGTRCTASGSGDIADTVDLPAGRSLTYTATGTVAAEAADTLVNTVTVEPPAGVDDPDRSNNVATDVDWIESGPREVDVAVTKTNGVDQVVAGQEVTYTIVVENVGRGYSTEFTVRDVFPPQLVNVRWECEGRGGGHCTASGSGEVNDRVGMPARGSVIYTVTGTVPCDATGMLVNTATVVLRPWIVDLDPSNNVATDRDPITPGRVDLTVSKTNGVDQVSAGEKVTYTIVVENLGTCDVTGATVSDLVPLSDVTWTCQAGGGASCTAGGSGEVDDTVAVPAGGTLTYVVTGTVACDGAEMLVNTVTVAPPAGVEDTDPSNNVATDRDPITPGRVDLTVSKTNGLDQVSAGQEVTYTIVVGNLGPCAATGVVVSDPLPLSDPTWNCQAQGGASCTAAGSGDLNDTVTVPVGGTLTYVATGTVGCEATGVVRNTATVEPGNDDDPDPSNNSSTDEDPIIVSEADLRISKTASHPIVTAGEVLSYTITVTNAGPAAVVGATVRDQLPAALIGASWTCTPAASCDVPSGMGDVRSRVDLAAGATVTFQVTGAMRSDFLCTTSNTAVVEAGSCVVDPNPSNNRASADFDVFPAGPGVRACKTLSGAFVEGGIVTYTVRLLNPGPLPQPDNPGSEFVDVLPPELILLAATASSGTIVTAGNTVSWDGSIPVFATVTITLTARIADGTIGETICNQGTVFSDPDSDGTNDLAVPTDDPRIPGGGDPTCFEVGGILNIPTLSQHGLLLLALGLLGFAWFLLRRVSPTVGPPRPPG